MNATGFARPTLVRLLTSRRIPRLQPAMPLDIVVVMDPIASIRIAKDSTFAMLLEAQRRGHRLWYVVPGGLFLRGGEAVARMAPLSVRDDPAGWFELGEVAPMALGRGHVVLMRKDPPVDAEYIHDTQILGLAQRAGALVVNDPQGLRDYNEKLAALLFPECCPPTLVTRDPASLKAFVAEHRRTVLKPLDGMGGRSIFLVDHGEANSNVILETLTQGGTSLAMAQRFLPEISEGDKRILLVDGEPVDYCLARIPQGDEFRGNLAVGGRGEARPLSERDRWIAARVGPEMKRRGMVLVGLDVIGDYLTEVNVTSPTCIREIDAQFGLNISSGLFDAIEARAATAA
ncbi:glutathione synthase [Lysobacter spongiicola DSM 21749]|uniref:Glutathione synthetase n=2 Tax=Novilysobacter TaxID=3382699 RepID=A0A1T4QYU2_9GAMM|nr:glutathione synthase [Lysobacter spongiicola DSM 21749]